MTDLFNSLTPLEKEAIRALLENPFLSHNEICEIAYCSRTSLTHALSKVLKGESVQSRLRLLDRMGLIHIPPDSIDRVKGKMVKTIFQALIENPSATLLEVSEITGYAPHTVRNQSKKVYYYFDYSPPIGLPSRLVRLDFYVENGWADLQKASEYGREIR